MSYQDILYEIDRRVATITLNRPETHNALTNLMLEEIEHALETAEQDGEVVALVITGAGEEAFRAGIEL